MGRIIKIAGPLVVAENMSDASIYDVVKVGNLKLIGEILEMKEGIASIQVYEETFGISVGEQVESTNEALSVELGPGLIGSIFDGIQRPLSKMSESGEIRIKRGVNIEKLDRDKKWDFDPVMKVGDIVFER